jgi:superfamily I DNA and/or RNA helicase/very-short-patch-repair endonuclease
VIDEASQCDIASALPLLMRAKRAVIIGDPLQLRHVANIDTSTDRMLLDQNQLIESLEWSYSSQSLFDLAAAIRDEDSMITLRDHHRSDAQIIEYSNKQFYDGQLRVATKHENLVKPKKDEAAIRWVEVKGTSIRPSQGSVTCAQEAKKVVEEIERLAGQGYKGSIGVVTPFAPQARMISDLLAQRDDLTGFLRSADILVATAHSFQGDERDVIIMSPALQSGAPDSAIKFVSGQANLFNVAVTRARATLMVVGNRDAKELNKVPHIQAFVKYVDQIGKASEKKLTDVNKDYGPKFPSERRDKFVSDFEIKLYEALYEAGIKTTPQLSVDQYRLDLALVDGNRKLDIEVDGELYHRHWSGENVRRDMLRSQRLIELGWDVQRFWVYQIRDDIDSCVRRVKKWLK